MASWTAEFDGGAVLSPSVSIQHTRAYATVDAAGQPAPANMPMYGPTRVFCSPPRASDVVTLDNTSGTTHIPAAAGRWSDGRPCAVHYRATATSRVAIHIGTSIGANAWTANPDRFCNILCDSTPDATFNPSGRKNTLNDLLRGAGTAQGESGDWIYIPVAWQIVEGGIFALCEAFEWDGTSAYQSRAVALMRWDDTLPGAAGTNKFTLVFRAPSVQNGQRRGQQWAMPAAFDVGVPNERILTFTDYRNNPNSTGWQCFAVRLYRGPTGAYLPDVVAPIATGTGDASGSGIHGHCLAVQRQGNGLTFLVIIGDTANSQTIAFVRQDMNFLQGHTLTVADRTPSSVTWLVTLPTNPETTSASGGNGWTVYPYAGGNPFSSINATTFTNATWTNSGRTLADSEVNTTLIGSRVGYYCVINAGTGVTGPTLAKITAHSGTTLTLDRDINGASGDATDIGGYICSPAAAHQPVGCHQLPDGRLFFGCDESTPSGLIANLPSWRADDTVIRWTPILGRSMTTHGREWNSFQAISDQAQRDEWFVGLYTSSSGVSSWNSQTAPGRLLIATTDGVADMYAPNQANANSNARMGIWGVHGGDEWLVYGPVSSTTVAIRTPRYLRKARPLVASSPAITQHLTAGSFGELGTSTPSTYEEISRAAVPNLIPGHVIPLPPAPGPVIRVSSRAPYGFLRVLTGSTVPSNAVVSVTGWLYNLPQPANNTTGTAAPFVNAAFSPTFQVGDGTSVTTATQRLVTQQCNRLDGTGWHRVTIQCGLPSGWSGGGASTNPFPLSLALRTENGFRFSLGDMLFVPEAVTSGVTEIPAIAPPVGAASVPEARTRLNVPKSQTRWAFFGAFAIPAHASDEYAVNRNTSRAWFTLSDGTNYLKVTADPSGNQISVTDGTNTVNCAAPAGQEMSFDRDTQVYIGLSLSGTTLTVTASVGGTVLNSASGTVIPLQYDRILSGDQSNANGEPLLWWILRGWDNEAYTGAQLVESLNSIGGTRATTKEFHDNERQRVKGRGPWYRRFGSKIGLPKEQ